MTNECLDPIGIFVGELDPPTSHKRLLGYAKRGYSDPDTLSADELRQVYYTLLLFYSREHAILLPNLSPSCAKPGTRA